MKGLQSARNEDASSGHKKRCEENGDGGTILQHKTPSNVASDKNVNKDESSREQDRKRSQDDVAKGVTELRDNDIVFGRGYFSQNREGNVRMRKIIEKYKIQYQNVRKSEKKELLQIVYREIMEDGARFLRRIDENKWEVVEKSDALKKVGQTMRDKRLDSPSLFLSEPTCRLRQSISIVAPVVQRPNAGSLSLPRTNLMRMQHDPTITYPGATSLQHVGRGTGRGMFICDPMGMMPQSYALSSQMDYHLWQQERHRHQLTQRAILLHQMREATNAATGWLANHRLPTQQAGKLVITKSDTEEQKEQIRK